jgi:hypothetical protein
MTQFFDILEAIGPVVQWIEHSVPNRTILVRLQVGSQESGYTRESVNEHNDHIKRMWVEDTKLSSY